MIDLEALRSENRRKQVAAEYAATWSRLVRLLPGCDRELASFEYLIKMAAISNIIHEEFDRCVRLQSELHTIGVREVTHAS